VILVPRNAILSPATVPERIAAETLARRGPDYATEVRRLLDAALSVIAEQGSTTRARVVDIVTAAGLSNDAFYRHFPSKDAMVVALLEDGTERLRGYLAHQMAKEPSPEGKVRRWVEGLMSQTESTTAATTLAVLWNGSSVGAGLAAGAHNSTAPLAILLHEPFTALGSKAPATDASLVAHAVLGKVSDYLWARSEPTAEETGRIIRFCVEAARRGNKAASGPTDGRTAEPGPKRRRRERGVGLR
jgi:AcrR family transcriptional regulator